MSSDLLLDHYCTPLTNSGDEHMGTSYMTFQKSAQFSWKELPSRIKQTHGQVNANLSSYHNLENMAALPFTLLLVELRYHMEEVQQLTSS